ncbi:multidrug resistance-associated protein 7 [Nephila pilipes]|uniref:ABC-type xenobiotic transporter n=1 Tax=Nephila pilipes TaxID=299642 RepID=A0A8X6QE42_NEPPI|nr:multidrug resistance-associated protein 7 [Nephila pilipes]
MDKFLRRKDSSSRTDDEEPSISVTKNLKKVVKRKYDEDYIKYGFSWCGDETAPRPQCIIYGDQLSNESIVPSKLKRHLYSSHPSCANKDKQYFKRCLEQNKKQKKFMKSAVTVSEKVLKASYHVAKLIARHKKPHTVGETLIKPACMEIVRLMLEPNEVKEVNKVSLSTDTVKRHKFSILMIVFQALYIASFLPKNTRRAEHIWSQNLNSSLEEQEPLISSVLSRYYGFIEDIDSHDLGVAEESSNIFSKILFFWVHSLMLKGSKKNLKSIDDLYDLPVSLQTAHLSEKIFSYSNICDDFKRKNYVQLCCKFIKIRASPLVLQLHKVYACEFYSIGILKFISDISSFGGPLLLNALVSFLESNDEKSSNDGYYYTLGLFLVTFVSALSTVHYNYLISRIGLKIKASVMMMVYKKTLCLNKISLSGMNTGEILNFISTDSDRIVNFCSSFHQFWSLPLQVIIALVLLYQQLHYCFIIGVLFMILIIPINQVVAKKIACFSTLMMKAKDKRIKIMNEIISGIRIIKMNTWEKIFCKKLEGIRYEEVKYLKKRKYLDALCVYFWATTPVLISFLTFTVFALLGYKLTAAKVFTSIALFNILIMPLNAIPWVLNGIVEAWISVKRVGVFLQLPDLNYEDFYSELGSYGPPKLEIINGIFSYCELQNDPHCDERIVVCDKQSGTSEFFLGPIGLKLLQGDFICVIGKVGSGKSSLISSILADLNCISGEIKINISQRNIGIGYVAQEPWIQQKTVQENILFGKTLNILKYRKVLEACALIDDLELLPYGDRTEVGDKGVTLSGGQKARIALARAVYQDFDMYLLDDPLSAVDAHVADHIFSNCIMGILKNKVRILCTHKIQYAEKADYLMILSNGKVISHAPPSQALQFYHLAEGEDSDFEEKGERQMISDVSSLESSLSESLVQKEEKEEGTVKLQVYKAYWCSVQPLLSILVLLFCFLMQSSKTVSDWWLSFWVSSIQQSNHSIIVNHSYMIDEFEIEHTGRSLMFYLSIYGSLAVVNSILTLFRAFLFAYAGIKAAVTLHDRLLKNIMKATSSFFDITPLGRIMNRFSSDIYCIDDAFPFILNIFLAQVFALTGCLIITCYALPWILVPISILMVFYCKLQQYYRFTSRELKRLSSISLSPIYAHFSETLNGHSTIKAMSAVNRFLKENMERIDSNIRACLATTAASQWLNLRLQFIGVIIVTAVAVVALLQREYSTVDPGLVGLALSYALSVTALLNGSITAFTETEKEIVCVERVMQYIQGINTESDGFSQQPPFAWPSHGVISFIHVSLRYRESCPYSLKGVSFETRPGEKIGVVGRTGSGKSSLIQVLFRMVDNFEGAVLIDGVNISNLQKEKLRSTLSVIPQHPFLFSGTIRENLDPHFLKSDSQIWKALKDCHIDEKLQSLGGLDVEVEEQGQNFSIGEKQLLCLARALLRRSKILCMDEATASIDYHTDSLIRHTVRMAFRRSTILVIAHRVETILDCDRVIVMKEGQIVEIDKPSSLLSDPNSEFHGLVYSKKEYC